MGESILQAAEEIDVRVFAAGFGVGVGVDGVGDAAEEDAGSAESFRVLGEIVVRVGGGRRR